MSSPIVPTQSTTGPESAAPLAPSHPLSTAGGISATGWSAHLESAVALQAQSDGPPTEVLDQMAHAARTYETLSSQGRELRFVRDETSGRTAVEVRDRSGNFLKRLSLAQALDVAAGAPLD